MEHLHGVEDGYCEQIPNQPYSIVIYRMRCKILRYPPSQILLARSSKKSSHSDCLKFLPYC